MGKRLPARNACDNSRSQVQSVPSLCSETETVNGVAKGLTSLMEFNLSLSWASLSWARAKLRRFRCLGVLVSFYEEKKDQNIGTGEQLSSRCPGNKRIWD